MGCPAEITQLNDFETRIIPRLTLVEGSKTQLLIPSSIVLGIILSILQLIDGTLTAIGVGRYGITQEGNPIVRGLMQIFGQIPAIMLVKLTAIAVILTLCKLSRQIKWIPLALKCMIAVYLVMAVLPWSYLLLTDLLS